MSGTFSSHPDGVEVRLGGRERELLAGLVHVLESVGERGEDAAADRLAPPAYPSDPHAQAEYARLVADELRSARGRDRDVFSSTLAGLGGRGVLSLDQAEAWVRVIGETRLVLGARLGIETDGWEAEAGGDPARGALLYLGYLQDELVEELAAGLSG